MVTVIAQHPDRLHGLPRCNFKDNGHIFMKNVSLDVVEVKTFVLSNLLKSRTRKAPIKFKMAAVILSVLVSKGVDGFLGHKPMEY